MERVYEVRVPVSGMQTYIVKAESQTVVDDIAGKHNTAFSEYLFIHFCGDSLDFNDIEGKDVCRKVLKNPKGSFETVTDSQVPTRTSKPQCSTVSLN